MFFYAQIDFNPEQHMIDSPTDCIAPIKREAVIRQTCLRILPNLTSLNVKFEIVFIRLTATLIVISIYTLDNNTNRYFYFNSCSLFANILFKIISLYFTYMYNYSFNLKPKQFARLCGLLHKFICMKIVTSGLLHNN